MNGNIEKFQNEFVKYASVFKKNIPELNNEIKNLDNTKALKEENLKKEVNDQLEINKINKLKEEEKRIIKLKKLKQEMLEKAKLTPEMLEKEELERQKTTLEWLEQEKLKQERLEQEKKIITDTDDIKNILIEILPTFNNYKSMIQVINVTLNSIYEKMVEYINKNITLKTYLCEYTQTSDVFINALRSASDTLGNSTESQYIVVIDKEKNEFSLCIVKLYITL